jgi:peptide/nickel transport system permease protein
MALGLLIFLLAVAMAVFAPLIAPQDPNWLVPNDRLLAPSGEHYFGTDQVGRDVFSRAVFGSRLSLIVGASVGFIATFLGGALGVLSGYYRRLDDILMRFVDGLMAFPGFLLALALVAILGPSLQNVITAIVIVDTPGVLRITRSSVLSLREAQYVEAAKAVGAGPFRILTRHVFPQLVAPLLVQGTYIFAIAILAEAGLSFLGAGVPPIVPSWGNMMGESKIYVQIAVWTLFFPGLFIALTVLGVNLVGDGLRDTLDPRLRRRI